MSNLSNLNGWLILLVALAALTCVIYWWFATKGTWREWPAGRSLMALLVSIVLISGTAAYAVLIDYNWIFKQQWYIIEYSLVLGSLVYVGHTIQSEIRKGRQRPPVDPRHSTGASVHHDKYDQEEPHV